MNRWNIHSLVFFSKHGKRRIIEFNLNDTTIITGASNTGKSAIIDSIDYCLGASRCNIASFVIERTTHIATKWTNGDQNFLLAREIRGSKGSDNMFIEVGKNITIPEDKNDLRGKGKKEKVRYIIEMLFGFDQVNDSDLKLNSNRITIRQAVPFMYLDKSVIDSNRILFHGLDDNRKAKFFIDAMPYFLGAITSEEMAALRKLFGLKKGVENEERKKKAFEIHNKNINNKATSLLKEAIQYGIVENENNQDNIIEKLKSLMDWKPEKIVLENKEQQLKLEKERSKLISEINNIKRKRNAVLHEQIKKSSFNQALKSQKAKLEIEKFFSSDEKVCPICSSELTESKEISKHIKYSFEEISNETNLIRSYEPSIEKYLTELDRTLNFSNEKLNEISNEIESLLIRSEEAKKLKDKNILANRIIGRISYFLENHKNISNFDESKMKRYKQEIEELNEKYGKEIRREKIAIAERTISTFSTKNFRKLPRGLPFKKSSINFFSNPPKVVLVEEDLNKEYQFKNVGSDENYLSIHLSLAFAMHKYFSKISSPVPGVLLLDQVSRPYYSNDISSDEFEVKESDDEKTLYKHFKFIFNQVEKITGLQVIILEHAYLSNSEKFKASTKYRWPKNSSERLIPNDWPVN